MGLATDEVIDLEPEMVRELRGRIGEEIDILLPAKLVGVGTKGITIDVQSTFGKSVPLSVHDFYVVSAASEDGR